MSEKMIFRGDFLIQEIARRSAAGEIKISQQALIDEIDVFGNRWNANMNWFWRDTLATRWTQNYSDPEHDIYQWSNFFTGPLAGYAYIDYDMVQAYGLPYTCTQVLKNQYIVQNPTDSQYYLQISNNDAIRMGFNGLAGFVAATGLPVLQ
jgi:hypothetical protein